MNKLPIVFLIHPVGTGASCAMNVLSAKLWLRALVDLLPDVVLAAPWLPYAETLVGGARSFRDTLVFAEGCHAAVAVGGELNHNSRIEWDLFGDAGKPRIDLTRPPMPALLTYETFAKTRVPQFQEVVTSSFRNLILAFRGEVTKCA